MSIIPPSPSDPQATATGNIFVKALAWVSNIVGNSAWVRLAILAFITLLGVAFCEKAHAAKYDFSAPSVVLLTGVSFGNGGVGPVAGIDAHFPVAAGHFDVFAGTRLWGSTPIVPNNWSWETGLHACRAHWCAAIGASFLQRIDIINGAHTNYFLELSCLLPWGRLDSISVDHISDAGTTTVNVGRQAVLAGWKLQ